MDMKKFAIQDKQYEFPYHYLPHFTKDGDIELGYELGWGIEYLAYMKYVADNIYSERPKSILDVGCGDGRFGNIYHRYDDKCSITGIDLSEKAIAFAKAFNPDLQFYVKDLHDVTEEYDCIVLIETLEHIPDESLNGFICDLSNALKMGGRLYITVPSLVRPLNPKHYRHYSIPILQEQIENSDCGLHLIRSDYIVPETEQYDRILKKLLYKRHKKKYIQIINQRIWRNDLICNEANGVKVFAVLEKTASPMRM